MARTISLSEEAFRALRDAKQEGESDSDVVLRLRQQARRSQRDPKAFLDTPAEFIFSEAEFEEIRERMDEVDRETPWEA